MDVILDANAYLSDIRMESIKFKNLFDYLRRTNSSLVIPRLVREETVAKHRHMLEVQAKKTEQAIQSLNRLIVDPQSQIQFHAPDPKYATRDLRKKFSAPAKRVTVRYYSDVDRVDVSDVFLRGVNRRRPANSEGEELRDVILWLIVLQYAETEHKHIAFITGDKGFWSGEDVHEHIRQDIAKRGVTVDLFRTVEDFVKSSAPAPTPIDEASVLTFFDVASKSDAIVGATKEALSTRGRRFGIPETVRSAFLHEAKLAEGTLYDINQDTKFAELSYAIIVIAELETRSPILGQERTPVGLIGLLGGGFGGFFGTRPEQSYFGPLAGFSGKTQSTPPVQLIVETYAVHGKAHISVRLVGGVASEIEVDRVEILSVQELGEAKLAAKYKDSE